MKNQRSLPHLSDLAVVDTLETHGRERRYRYFTAIGYSDLLDREKIDTTGEWIRPNTDNVGDFMALDTCAFYDTIEDLERYLSDTICSKLPAASDAADHRRTGLVKGAKRGRPPKKEKTHVNPLLPDGKRKRGRPPKGKKEPITEVNRELSQAVADSENNTETITETVKRIEKEAPDVVSLPKRKRGRPPKKRARFSEPENTTERPPIPETSEIAFGVQHNILPSPTASNVDTSRGLQPNASDRMTEPPAVQKASLNPQEDERVVTCTTEESKGIIESIKDGILECSLNAVDMDMSPSVLASASTQEAAATPTIIVPGHIQGHAIANKDAG